MFRRNKRTNLWCLVSIASVVGTGGAVRVSADSSLVPFTVEISGDAAFTSPVTVEFSGTGQATHMGRISDFGDIVITGGARYERLSA